MWIGLSVVAAALAASLWLARSARELSDARPFSALDSLARLGPAPTYNRGFELAEQERFIESLPYFRRALEVPTDAWQPHCDFATALFQATFQVRTRLGRAEPVTRSSYERAALIREGLTRLDQAQELAVAPSERVFVHSTRARQLMVWGLSLDALSEYRRAAALDSSWGRKARRMERYLEDPRAGVPE